MNHVFPEIKNKLGFGFMRLPKKDDQVDIPTTMQMVDTFLSKGFNYFDTAHGYLSGQSELVLRECLTRRYPREQYILTNKLSDGFFKTAEDIRPLFQLQLEQCGVDYFDFYLMHAMNKERHQRYLDMGAYDVVQALKAEGKLRHMGISFHDSAETLDRILTDRPDIEAVQLQFNYVDYEDSRVESRKCYEVCRKHGKPVFVMEPVKGGSLATLTPDAAALLPNGSPASYALRFVSGFEGIVAILSGMSTLEQVEENTELMGNCTPLTPEEQKAIEKVRTIYQSQHRIPCTVCRYCTDGCPAGIEIPELFALLNETRKSTGAEVRPYEDFTATGAHCLDCGQCEAACPQHLQIRTLLKEVDKIFKK